MYSRIRHCHATHVASATTLSRRSEQRPQQRCRWRGVHVYGRHLKREHRGVRFGDLRRKMTEKGHTEIVVKVYPNGDLDTIGGNTDSDTARDGDGVYFHSRRYNIAEERVVGFVVPRWVDP